MKILLVQPAKAPATIGGEDAFVYEPLALEYLAAGVARDHDVQILDLRLEKNLEQILEEYRPDIVGITSYTVHVNVVKRLFETIRQWNPAVDLDAFPFPDRRLTAGYRQRYYSEWMRPLASMRTSKGCPYRCSFCALWKITGGRYLKRDPERVVEELAGIDEQYVFFADDESLVDAARMETLARRIGEAGIRKRYFLYGRSDTIARNPELLALWRQIGLDRVFIGLEFCTDRDLEYISKGSTTADNEKAVRILQDLDIEIYASLILRPEFDHADFAALREYCRHLELTFATYAVLTPLPGTDFYQEVEDRLITHNYDFFDFIHTLLPTKLPLKDFYAAYYQLYRNGIPLSRQASILKRYPLKEIPAMLLQSNRILNRLKRAYLDYEDGGGVGGAEARNGMRDA